MSTYKCCKCKYELKRNVKKLVCAVCENKFHGQCVNIKDEDLKLISENENIQYHCDTCNKVPNISELKEMLHTCLIKMEEQKATIDRCMNFIKENLNCTGVAPAKQQRKSYTNVLLIKPVKEQKSDVTRFGIDGKD
ncbi:hypothetical protein WA026_021416 [Henosepilachna vigintioctopunctata]|uniref:PHD-type domain-containing protein n=1 Tax=Henosepilachna vigintioctopunctata TaxID=420089 RepID=A0AAW1TXP0_9CUCU